VQAAYVLGPERGALSPALIARCAHLVRIPTAFSLNVATAGAIVMYDRLRCLGRFASRPVAVGGAPQARTEHVQGAPLRRKRRI
jgi:tRNA C32,U32 (ribose-2'-O)-methylase TrmJ